MAFQDEAKIIAISGKGGNGCLSFRREKYIPRGGPDGGDGGDGGDVVVVYDKNLNSLSNLRGKKVFSAQSGKGGSGKNMKGESGDDLLVPVPSGTMIYSENDPARPVSGPWTVSCVFLVWDRFRGSPTFSVLTS